MAEEEEYSHISGKVYDWVQGLCQVVASLSLNEEVASEISEKTDLMCYLNDVVDIQVRRKITKDTTLSIAPSWETMYFVCFHLDHVVPAPCNLG